MLTLAYLAFGTGEHFEEAEFSIVSACSRRRSADTVRLLVVTDQPDRFEPYPVEVQAIDAETIKRWQEPDGYLYRVKIEALALALQRCGGSVVLVDSDTYFRRPPDLLAERLRPGHTLMDHPEDRIFGEPSYQRWADALLKHWPDRRLVLGNGYEYPLDAGRLVMWNSGVIGVPAENASLVDRVREMIGLLRQRTHFFNDEQFAISLVLQTETRVSRADDIIEHYCGDWKDPHFGSSKREFFQRQAVAFLQQHTSAEDRIQAFGSLRMRRFKRPLVYRILYRLFGQPQAVR